MHHHAVLGHPVAHSLSPKIHALFARQAGIDLAYEALDVAPGELLATLAHLHGRGYRGLNVTLPHKLAAFEACAEHSDAAAAAKSANTLVRTDAGWRGDNTDGVGLVRDLRENLKLGIAGKKILLLGAGGAVRGVLKPLLEQGPSELALASRSPWKPELLATEFMASGAVRPCTYMALKGDTFDLVINATSAGHQGVAVKLPGQLLAEGGCCYDLSYGKAFAPFRAWAQAQGAAVVADGLGMLVEQAAASFERWHGMRPQTGPVLAVLRNGTG